MLKLNEIYNMDCIDFLKEIKDDSVNLIITSPPYNCGIEYDNWDDNMKWDKYLEWCTKWMKECYRILKDDGRICINHYLNMNPDRFPLTDFINIQKEIKLHPSKLVIWDEKTLSCLTSWGSWLSASSPYIRSPMEGILISYKNQWKRIDKGETTINKQDFIEGVSGIWKIQPETQGLTKANFPVNLPLKCINLLSYKGDLVVDPFMGSGSTAIACLMSDRKYLGCDNSGKYVNIANERIRQYKIAEENKNIYKLFFKGEKNGNVKI